MVWAFMPRLPRSPICKRKNIFFMCLMLFVLECLNSLFHFIDLFFLSFDDLLLFLDCANKNRCQANVVHSAVMFHGFTRLPSCRIVWSRMYRFFYKFRNNLFHLLCDQTDLPTFRKIHVRIFAPFQRIRLRSQLHDFLESVSISLDVFFKLLIRQKRPGSCVPPVSATVNSVVGCTATRGRVNTIPCSCC